MAIRVIQANSDVVMHKDGDAIAVTDGHLYVTDSDGTDIAIYAPGKWVSAARPQTASS